MAVLGAYCSLLFFSFSTVLFFKETQALPFSKSLDFAPEWSVLTWYPCLPIRDRASTQRKATSYEGSDRTKKGWSLATSRLTRFCAHHTKRVLSTPLGAQSTPMTSV